MGPLARVRGAHPLHRPCREPFGIGAPGMALHMRSQLSAAMFAAVRVIRRGTAMKRPIRHRLPLLLSLLLCAASANAADTPPPKYPSLPSETPAHFTPDHSSFGYTIRDVMIPMRDKVKLHTMIMIPKGAHDAPMLLTRTPYDAKNMVTETEHGQLSGNMGTALQGYDNAVPVIVAGGYIRVIQDVRGKYGSEGDFVMNRPMRGPLNHTPV